MSSNQSRLKKYLDGLGVERVVIVDDQYDVNVNAAVDLIMDQLEDHHIAALAKIDPNLAKHFDDVDWTEENDVDLAKVAFKADLLVAGDPVKRRASKLVLEDEIVGNSVSEALTAALRSESSIELRELSPADWEREGADLVADGKRTIYVLDYVLSQSKGVDGAKLAGQVNAHESTEAVIMYSSRLDDGPETEKAKQLKQAVFKAVPKPTAKIVYVSKAEARVDPLALVCALQVEEVGDKLPEFFAKLEQALAQSGVAALESWNKLDSRHKAQIVLQTAFAEGSDPFDVLYRVMSILVRDEMHRALDTKFGGGQYPKTVDHLFSNLNGMVTPLSEATRMAIKLNHLEHYADVARINQRGLPIQPGDIFESDGRKAERNRKRFIFMAQPCQAQLRSDGQRGSESNRAARWESGFLVPIEDGSPKLDSSNSYYDGIGAGPLFFTKVPPVREDDYEHDAIGGWLNFRRAIPVPLMLLDLCMLDNKGRCRIKAEASPLPGSPPATRAWLEAHAQFFRAQLAAAGNPVLKDAIAGLGADVASAFSEGNRPWFLGHRGRPKVQESDDVFALDLTRVARMRLEYTQVYMGQFLAFLGRQGLERPFARIRGDP